MTLLVKMGRFVRGAVMAILPIGLAGGVSASETPSDTGSDADDGRAIFRVEEIRLLLLDSDTQIRVDDNKDNKKLRSAQWGNWGNWNNWRDWADWNDWPNWNNWYNY